MARTLTTVAVVTVCLLLAAGALVLYPADDTEYAASFSESAFGAVKMGATRDEVERLLGPPVRVIEASHGRIGRLIETRGIQRLVSFPDLPQEATPQIDRVIYYYSRPRTGSGRWQVRAVTFSAEGKVIDLDSKTFDD